MTNSAEITHAYYELLRDADRADALRSIHDQLFASLRRRNVVYKGDPVSRFLAPLFVTARERDHYREVTEAMMRCVEEVIATCGDVPAMDDVRASLAAGERELFEIDHRYRGLVPLCRLDAFVVDGVVRFCEFNCDTPGGNGWIDGLVDSLRETSVMGAFAEGPRVGADRLLPAMLQCLRSCYEEWCEAVHASPSASPRVAIVTMLDRDPSATDIDCIKRYFIDQGHDCVVSDVRDSVYQGGRYLISGEPVDIVLRRGLGGWWIDSSEAYQGLKRAVVDGAVCMVNPLCSQLGGRKSLFAVMQSEPVRARLGHDQRALIDTHLPWTRVVKDRQTSFHGDEVDLLSFIEQNRDRLVLKPVSQSGGQNVTVGIEVDDQAWREAVRVAAAEGYVVQEYIPIPTLELPALDADGRLSFEEKKVNINFFSCNGIYASSMVRVSDSHITNVSAGGGMIPLFYVAPEQQGY